MQNLTKVTAFYCALYRINRLDFIRFICFQLFWQAFCNIVYQGFSGARASYPSVTFNRIEKRCVPTLITASREALTEEKGDRVSLLIFSKGQLIGAVPCFLSFYQGR
jgi:hypothetical protein